MPPKGSSGYEVTLPLMKTMPAVELGDQTLPLLLVVGPGVGPETELGDVGQLDGLVDGAPPGTAWPPGPKASSVWIRISGVMPVSTVGG